MHFDFVDLRLLVHLSDTHNLARAAERSHLSAPAASARIRNLERDLGFPLLYRSSQGMTPTPAGESFVHHARLVLERVQHLAGDMQEYGEGIKGHVRIWANTTAISEFLPDGLSTFLRDHPDVNVDLREVLSAEIVKGVADGATDIGIVAGNVHAGALEMLPYRDDRLVLATSMQHPMARLASVDFAQTLHDDYVSLTTSSAIHMFIDNAAQALGSRIKLRIQVGNFEAVCRMIEAGVGIGVVPESVARRHARAMSLAIIPLNDPWAERKLKICVRALGDLPPFARALVERLMADAPASAADPTASIPRP
ncbi:LysR family transcriptional regulator [Bordetella genomosp. 9]|uniref:LysR family transcriptional regulator n=1 Tax=Bordetella genomosp. 9 TaxID=1416803 RepID=A0A261R9A0_9BORD|nr:LysR family transcriptional regulator [Bordetella genomosp. 9]OZI21578.1 LysR family transcriptional regulator [Bordetella genomosp. 9]